MEPRIQYVQTADGVSIAYYTLGEGMPFVGMPSSPISHIHLEWQWPEYRRWHERLAEKRKLVRYDNRGFGLSDRDTRNFSLDAYVIDLEAVVDRLGLERFALFAPIHSGPIAIAYAVRNPERVSHLILWCTYARPSDMTSLPQIQATRSLIEKDWETYTETIGHVLTGGWATGEQARQLAAFIRQSVTPEVIRAAIGATLDFDVTALLPQVTAPTLVLHRREVRFPTLDGARGLASEIPDARLALLEGSGLMPYLGDTEAVVRAIDEFVGEGEQTAPATPPLAKEDVHTILFTDMEGSTTLTQRLGDAKAQVVLRAHNTIIRDALKAHSGSEIKHTGDGIMASFTSASRALECAIAMQRAFAQHSEANPDTPICVRIGLNAGEPVAEDEDLFGTAVQLAARICAQAEPAEILAPVVVRELAAGKGFLFSDRGDVALRGFEDPVRLFEVGWRED